MESPASRVLADGSIVATIKAEDAIPEDVNWLDQVIVYVDLFQVFLVYILRCDNSA